MATAWEALFCFPLCVVEALVMCFKGNKFFICANSRSWCLYGGFVLFCEGDKLVFRSFSPIFTSTHMKRILAVYCLPCIFLNLLFLSLNQKFSQESPTERQKSSPSSKVKRKCVAKLLVQKVTRHFWINIIFCFFKK